MFRVWRCIAFSLLGVLLVFFLNFPFFKLCVVVRSGRFRYFFYSPNFCLHFRFNFLCVISLVQWQKIQKFKFFYFLPCLFLNFVIIVFLSLFIFNIIMTCHLILIIVQLFFFLSLRLCTRVLSFSVTKQASEFWSFR